MKYVNAHKVLPEDMIRKIQKYMNGGFLYIPRKEGEQMAWGEASGARSSLRERDALIFERYAHGAAAAEIAREFYLSEPSVRRIVAREKKLRSRSVYTHS